MRIVTQETLSELAFGGFSRSVVREYAVDIVMELVLHPHEVNHREGPRGIEKPERIDTLARAAGLQFGGESIRAQGRHGLAADLWPMVEIARNRGQGASCQSGPPGARS